MPLLNISVVGVRRLQRSNSDGDSTSQLSSLPPTEDSYSAGSINTVEPFEFPGVAIFTDDENESFDPIVKPLMKERRLRLGSRLKSLSSLHNIASPAMAPIGTPETANETINDSPKSITAITKMPVRRFRSLVPPSFLVIPTKFVSRKKGAECSIVSQDEGSIAYPGKKERDFWNRAANKTLDTKGIVHLRTAETLLQLGNSHLCCEEYKDALTVFKGATRIFRKIYGDSDLSVALALDRVGLAACQLSKMEPNLRNALDALNQSFLIRYHILGPTHVDTIDTLNNMAGVYYHLHNLAEACQAYYEVWIMRQAVFGPNHASVAVAAHSLGSVHVRLSQVEEASKYYYGALDVYRHLNLSEEHPTVRRLLRDIDGLGYVMSTRMGDK